jgi:hypothetical protein
MPFWVAVVVWVAGLALVAWLADRALVACELRGWITYRLTPRPQHEIRRAAGSALVGLDGLFRPAARHIVGVTREAAVHREADESGDGGETPTRPPASE